MNSYGLWRLTPNRALQRFGTVKPRVQILDSRHCHVSGHSGRILAVRTGTVRRRRTPGTDSPGDQVRVHDEFTTKPGRCPAGFRVRPAFRLEMAAEGFHYVLKSHTGPPTSRVIQRQSSFDLTHRATSCRCVGRRSRPRSCMRRASARHRIRPGRRPPCQTPSRATLGRSV